MQSHRAGWSLRQLDAELRRPKRSWRNRVGCLNTCDGSERHIRQLLNGILNVNVDAEKNGLERNLKLPKLRIVDGRLKGPRWRSRLPEKLAVTNRVLVRHERMPDVRIDASILLDVLELVEDRVVVEELVVRDHVEHAIRLENPEEILGEFYLVHRWLFCVYCRLR